MAFAGVVTASWLGALGIASAGPGSTPSTLDTAVSSTPAAPTSSSRTSPPASASPTAAATSSDPTAAKPSPKADPPSGLTASFNSFCGPNFGWDVTNHTAVTHTVHVEVNGTQVGAAVVVAAGSAVHVPLAENIEAGSEVQLVDETGGVIDSFVMTPAGCTAVHNISATIRANTSYTLSGFRDIASMPPSPRHGVVTGITVSSTVFGAALRYSPDPCFAGIDTFGYRAPLDGQQGVVTVTVLSGGCEISVHRSTTDCASNAVRYTATNPYSLPAHLVMSNSATPGADRDLLVPAHRTAVVATLGFAAITDAQVTFAVRDTTHTVLADQVTFPCPSLAAAGQAQPPPLAATGSAPTPLAALGGAAVALGALITLVARLRKPRTRR